MRRTTLMNRRLGLAPVLFCGLSCAFAYGLAQEKAPPAKPATAKADAAKKAAEPKAEEEEDPYGDSEEKKKPAAKKTEEPKKVEPMEPPPSLDLPKIVGPSDVDPWIPLPVRDEESAALAQAGVNLGKRLDLVTRHFRYRLDNNTVPELNGQEIAVSFAANQRLNRVGNELEFRLETAGFDVHAYSGRFGFVIQKTAEEFKRQPGFPNEEIKFKADKLLYEFNKGQKPQIEKIIAAGQFQQAFDQTLAYEEKLDVLLVWFEPTERVRYLAPVQDLRAKFMDRWNKERKQALIQKIDNAREELAQLPVDLVDRLAVAGTALAKRGVTDWNGKQLSGPDLLDPVREEWLDYQMRAVKLASYDMLIPEVQRKTKTLPAVAPEIAKFNDALAKAVAKLIEADASDCTAEDAPELYAAYLEKLSTLNALWTRTKFQTEVETALDKIAEKDAAFAGQVAAYRTATRDLLYWRKLAVDTQAAAQSGEYPLAAHKSRSALERDRNVPGALANTNGSLEIIDPVGTSLQNRSSRLLETMVTVRNVVVPLTSEGKPTADAVSQFQDRCWGVLPSVLSTAVLDEAVGRLKQELLSEEKPPLTLDAATSLWKARNGYFGGMGAIIDGVTVQPYLIGRVRTPEIYRYSATLGDVAIEANGPTALKQLNVFYEFSEPTWVRHDHFFCNLDE